LHEILPISLQTRHELVQWAVPKVAAIFKKSVPISRIRVIRVLITALNLTN